VGVGSSSFLYDEKRILDIVGTQMLFLGFIHYEGKTC
jgi:hypothetical protein